jgi:hypothetical protein
MPRVPKTGTDCEHPEGRRMLLPEPCGPLSGALIRALRADTALLPVPDGGPPNPLHDDDLQLALWTCLELHYRGFDDADDAREWDPTVIRFRRSIEDALLDQLRREVPVPPNNARVADTLRELVDADDGPQLSRFLQRRATRAQFEEFAIHRSLYQLKEADPHTWAIPRLVGRAKAALVEIQFDEYGGGTPARMHSELYRKLLRGLDLDDSYAAYIDAVPGITLAVGNVMSMFGLRRELRGALVGHLAAYELTSSAPCRRYGQGLRRLGGSDATCEFFDEHVTADALHEQLAAHDLCGGLAETEPHLAPQILWGAAACLYVDGQFATHVLHRWADGRSSLRNASAPRDAELAGVGAE